MTELRGWPPALVAPPGTPAGGAGWALRQEGAMTRKRHSQVEFVASLEAKQIPAYPPVGSSRYGWQDYASILDEPAWEAKQVARKVGMFSIVDRHWTRVLAEWIGPRRVLEVMAGAGWLAKAMIEHGVAWLATDNGSWQPWPAVAPVLELSAREAVRRFGPDSEILVCSWPPYKGRTFADACRRWGPDKPIVYIGESEGGCTANDTFFHHFVLMKEPPTIPLMAWKGLHDEVQIGFWREGVQ